MNRIVRAATAEDQAAITRMVRAAGLNPLRLDWPNFVIAEEVTLPDIANRRVIGIAQLRPRKPDAQELASLVVAPEYQGQGLGVLLVHTLIRRAAAPLYLMCEGGLVTYYRRFGFVEVTNARVLPSSMGWLVRIGRVLAPLISRLEGEPVRLAVMVLPRTLAFDPQHFQPQSTV